VHDNTTSEGKGSARRRLLRGTFAAPAVLTLYSGSAFAVRSNLRCIANKVTSTSADFPPAGPTDTWLRVPAYLSANGKAWVRGSDIIALKGGNASIQTYIASTEWQMTTSPFTKTTNPNPNPNTANMQNYVAVRVDASGNIVGIVGTGTTGSSAIAQTCWASFRIGP
jgi:hypothetical protein